MFKIYLYISDYTYNTDFEFGVNKKYTKLEKNHTNIVLLMLSKSKNIRFKIALFNRPLPVPLVFHRLYVLSAQKVIFSVVYCSPITGTAPSGQ